MRHQDTDECVGEGKIPKFSYQKILKISIFLVY